MKWEDIGSGTIARSFMNVKKLFIKNQSGPAIEQIEQYTIWSLRTGKAIINCVPEYTPDEMIPKALPIAGDIRIESFMK